MNGPGWSAWPAPAKLNLFLHITGRRPDGYHALQTVFRLLDWGDTLRLRVRDDGRIVRHGVSAAGVPESDDLTVRAGRLLQSESKCRLGADIVVEKSIPVGGGFGGGSSDAATTLVALDALWNLNLGIEALAALGLQLGADVPVFVRGHNAWAEGIGEQLTPVALPPAWYVLADPGVHVPTAVLFQTPELTRDSAPATMADFVSGTVLDNAFEPLLRRREPAVEAAFAALARACGEEACGEEACGEEACSPRLTGTGSGCFVEFADRGSAEAALAALPSSLRAWLAAGADVSPLLAALEAYRLQGRRQEA